MTVTVNKSPRIHSRYGLEKVLQTRGCPLSPLSFFRSSVHILERDKEEGRALVIQIGALHSTN